MASTEGPKQRGGAENESEEEGARLADGGEMRRAGNGESGAESETGQRSEGTGQSAENVAFAGESKEEIEFPMKTDWRMQ